MNLRNGKSIKYQDENDFKVYTETRLSHYQLISNFVTNGVEVKLETTCRNAYMFQDELEKMKAKFEEIIGLKISWFETDQIWSHLIINTKAENIIAKYIKIEEIFNIRLTKLINYHINLERDKINDYINKATTDLSILSTLELKNTNSAQVNISGFNSIIRGI